VIIAEFTVGFIPPRTALAIVTLQDAILRKLSNRSHWDMRNGVFLHRSQRGKRYNRLSRYFWRSIMGKKRRKMGGTVEKIIKPLAPGEPEKAQISVEEADTLYREIRVENVVTDEKGGKASLKPGADVDVIIEANSDATKKKPENS
jgi:hypothetical protein